MLNIKPVSRSKLNQRKNWLNKMWIMWIQRVVNPPLLLSNLIRTASV
jgi:hypothetical protein